MANLRTNNLCGRGFVSVNDGTIWSSLFDGSTLGSYPVTNAFDGDISTFMYPAAGTQITWTAPNGGIKSGRIEVYVYAGNTHPIVTVNGVSTGAVVGSDYGQQGNWVDVTSLVGGNLKTITCFGQTIGGVARQSGFSAVRINGEILIDRKYGTTGGKQAYRGSVNFVSKTETDYLQVSANSDLSLTGDFTIEYWTWISDSETHTRQVSSGNYYTAGKNGNWYFGLSPSSGNVVFYTYDAQSNAESVNISKTITLNSWHHAAAVRSGNTVTLYLNGISIGSGTVSKDLVDGADGGLQIGRLTVYGSHMGYISNFRILNGEALYTSNFTPPFTELKAIPNTVLLCCQNSDDVTQEETGKTITGNGNLANADFNKSQPKIIPPYGVDAGNTFGGPIQQSSQGYMYFPTGRTEERGRGRGIIAGGSPGTDNNEQIEFLDIQSDGVVTEFGELATARRGCGGCSSSTRGLIGGGTASNPSPTFTNSMEFITIATTANGKDFGDLNNASRNIGGVSNQTRGLFAGGGDNPALIDVIDFFTIASAGNATDFGNLTDAKKGISGVGSPTRGLFGGGYNPSHTDDIDLVTIATAGNATDFGNLTLARAFCGGVSSPTRGVWGGGGVPSAKSNVIDFVTIATTGNATDFGDLPDEKNPDNSQICSHLRGLFIGGENPGPAACNIIDVITIATTGNATDFGDIRTTTSQSAGCSDCHGGLS